MFHLYPPNTIAGISKAQNEISKINKNEKLKGLLIGGLYCAEKGQTFNPRQSLDLFGRLKHMLKKFPNKDFSIFYGQNVRKVKGKYPSSGKLINFLYDNSTDEYFVNIEHLKMTPENIKKRFKFIRISPNDEVFIKGQKIDSKLIET